MTQESPIKKTWRRLLRNKPAIISLVVIVLAIILAILGSAVAMDKTPDADDQILELANVNPGFTTKMLLVRKNREENKVNPATAFFMGRENPYQQIPISSYQFNDSGQIVVQAFKGEEHKAEEMRFSLADVVYPLSATSPDIHLENGKLNFTDFNGQPVSADIQKLQKETADKHIVLKKYRLGADDFGRDILSRLILGIRVSLSVGIVAVIISMTIGIFMGAIAGYFGGRTDDVITFLINIIWSIPTILLAMAISFSLGAILDSYITIFIAIGLSMWVETARIVRGQVLSVREMEYIQAAKGLGYSHFRIILKHVLPNIIGPIMVLAASDFAAAILIESGLSFIGLGVKPPTPSWGNILNAHFHYLTSNKAFLALAPGICIMVMVLVFNLLGNGLRDAFDVKGKIDMQ